MIGSVAARTRAWDRPHWADAVVPLVAAACWALVLVPAAELGIDSARSIVFVGGPIVLLSGLHARISGYLHADARMVLLPLPLPPRVHFAASRARHVRGLATTASAGLVAIAAARALAFDAIFANLALDWLALVLVAALVEPAIAGASAYFGRRFPEGSGPHAAQLSLGGGWTLPEATIHLWAPALGIGTAAALAMPAQLAIDRWFELLPLGRGLVGFAAMGLAAAVVIAVTAPLAYGRGMFEAVPWLHQAIRTLAGPPEPDPAPRWIARVKDPVLRLILLQHQRMTPAPLLRALALVGCGVVIAVRSGPPAAPALGLLAALAALWLVPATRVAKAAPQRAAILSALPLPPRARAGGHPLALPLLLAPVAIATLAVLVRLGGGA